MKRTTFTVALIIAGVMATGSAWADTDFNLSGFGTLAATYSSTRDADYQANIFQPNGPGASGATEFGVDTKAGVQLSANMGGGWTSIVQAVTAHRYDNSYTPILEWANLKYQVTPDVYVRAGRVLAPVFLTSDYINVGYSQTTVRPPYDLTMLNPITHLDGGEVSARFNAGPGILTTQFTAGKTKDGIPITTPELKTPGAKATLIGTAAIANLTYELDTSTFRAGYSKYIFNPLVDIPQLALIDHFVDLYQMAVPDYVPDIKHRDLHFSMWSLGYSYDPGTWLVQAEYASVKSDTILVMESQSAWYVLAGYRWGKFTPYASYSRLKAKPEELNAVSRSACSLVAQCANANYYGLTVNAADIISIANRKLNVYKEQSTIGLGVRYDFYRNMALKVQYERIYKPADPSPNRGGFVNEVQDLPPSLTNNSSSWLLNSRTVNLLTVALDFVF